MKNIHYYPVVQSDFFYISQNGVCIYQANGYFEIHKSEFYNISSSCIFSNDVNIVVIKSIFGNPKTHSIHPSFKPPLKINRKKMNFIVLGYVPQLFNDKFNKLNGAVDISDSIFYNNKGTLMRGAAVYVTPEATLDSVSFNECVFSNLESG